MEIPNKRGIKPTHGEVFQRGILPCQHINTLTHYPDDTPGQGVMKFMEDAQVGGYHRRPETGGRKKTGSDRHTCKQNH